MTTAVEGGETVQRPDRFPALARLVLLIAIILQVIGLALVVSAVSQAALPLGVIVYVALLMPVTIAVFLGLGSGAAWARPVAIFILWALVLEGIVRIVLALSVNTIHIPILSLISLYALAAGRPGPFRLPADPADRLRAQFGIGLWIAVEALAFLPFALRLG